MKKRLFFLFGAAIALLLLAGCPLPDQPASSPPEGTLSYEDLIASLDALQGPQSQSITEPGRTVFSFSGQASLSAQDLAAFIGAIKGEFAAYVRSSAGGSLYLVTPVKLTLPGSNSGLMWVPFTWWQRKSFPIISYQHGTQVYRECAPSRYNPNPLTVFSSPDQTGAMMSYVECVMAGLMASAGYIVVMPDYQGFGDSTVVHPYVHQSLGNSVRDIVLAARTALAGKIVRPNAEVYLTGYSEGGYATMAGARALQQAGIPVSGIVPGDGPYDLSGVMLDQMLSGLPVKAPWYLLYTASGYNSMRPDILDFDALLVDSWAYLMTNDNPFDGSRTNAEVNAIVPPTEIPRLMIRDEAIPSLTPPAGAVYGLLAANNGYGGWIPTAPLVLIHCPVDDVVPYANSLVVQAAYAGLPPGLVSLVNVPPVPFIDSFLGSLHAAAFPTAMLAAFTAIQTIND